jgi:very-short-patch-repair endonuclease
MTNIRSARARRLRREKTDAERRLWRYLRELNKQGFHFRQQVPIGPYIADFAEHSARLIIEVDGGQHGHPECVCSDAGRTNWLESQNYKVLRFWNCDVLTNLEGVARSILLALGVLVNAAEFSPSSAASTSPEDATSGEKARPRT